MYTKTHQPAYNRECSGYKYKQVNELRKLINDEWRKTLESKAREYLK